MKITTRLGFRVICGLLLIFAAARGITASNMVTLNDIEIGIDDKSGCITRLARADLGVLLDAKPESAGLVDLAYPMKAFTPMRLASRFSAGVSISQSKDSVTISWDQLGPSRTHVPLPEGKVSAEVVIKAAPDGKSVILTCAIQNKSSAQVPQILFPDLWGLRPVAGVDETFLRLPAKTVYPFRGASRPNDGAFYALEGQGLSTYGEDVYAPKRWLDLGGPGGGLAIAEKGWDVKDRPTVYSQRFEADPTGLRLMREHRTSIEPGQSWTSGEFWLNLHTGEWTHPQ